MKLAAAVLSAYMAMTGMNADLPQPNTRAATNDTTIEESITNNAVAPNATTARRRPVRHPAPPSHVMIDVSADEDVRYTNHEAVPVSVRTCIERSSTCANDLLAPGQSTTRNDLVRSLGRENATLEVYTTSNITGRAATLEVRARNDAIPTTQMTTERMNMPVMGANQTFSVYTWSPGTAELRYLLSNGVERDSETIQLNAGTTTLAAKPLALGEQLDLIPSGKAVMTSTLNGVQYRAKALSEASGRQFIVAADANATGMAKNPDPTAILSLTSMRYAKDTTATFANYASAVNWGTTRLDSTTNGIAGAVDIHGLRVNDVEQPFNAWSTALVQKDGATANTKFVTATRYNAHLNQLPESGIVSLFAAETDAAYTINAYNDAGTKTGTKSGTLLPNQNTDVDVRPLGGSRIELIVADRTDNVAGNPNLLLSATVNGVTKGGYRTEKPVPKVTGEQFMEKWLRPYVATGFFLNYDEAKCIIDEQCGVTGGRQLFQHLYPTSGYNGTETEFYERFKVLVDNDPNNGTLTTTRKPSVVLFNDKGVAGSHQFCFTLGPNNNNYCMPFNETNRAAVVNDLWSYEVRRADQLPHLYGGSTQTGPSLDYNPEFWNSTPK